MTADSQEQTYLVQCLNGHVHEVKPSTELEQKCKERADSGMLDALCLDSSECPYCIEDARERGRRNQSLCSNCGCAMMDPCEQQCLLNPSIPDSPYEGQIGRYISGLDETMDREIQELTLAHSYDA